MIYKRYVAGTGFVAFTIDARALLAKRETLEEDAESVAEGVSIVCDAIAVATNEVLAADASYRRWKAMRRREVLEGDGTGKKIAVTTVDFYLDSDPEFVVHKDRIREAQVRLTYAESVMKALTVKRATLEIRRDLALRRTPGILASAQVTGFDGIEGPYDSVRGDEGVGPWPTLDEVMGGTAAEEVAR